MMDVKLTRRESQVLTLMAQGLAAKVIAERLGIGVRTVDYHRVQAIAKLRAKNGVHAVAIAVRDGLIDANAVIATEAKRSKNKVIRHRSQIAERCWQMVGKA